MLKHDQLLYSKINFLANTFSLKQISELYSILQSNGIISVECVALYFVTTMMKCWFSCKSSQSKVNINLQQSSYLTAMQNAH